MKKFVFSSPKDIGQYPIILSLIEVDEGDEVNKGDPIALFTSLGSSKQSRVQSPFTGTAGRQLCKRGTVFDEPTHYLEFFSHEHETQSPPPKRSADQNQSAQSADKPASNAKVTDEMKPARPAPERSDADQRITNAFDNLAIYILFPFATGIFAAGASMLLAGSEITELHLGIILSAATFFALSFTKLRVGSLLLGQKSQRFWSLMFVVGFAGLTIGLGHKINPNRVWIWEKIQTPSFFEYQAPAQLQRDFNDFLEAE